MNIGLCCIATGSYKMFVPKLLEGVKKHFMPLHRVIVFVFNDEYLILEANERVSVNQYPIYPYKFPYATLMRYHIFYNHRHELSKMDYIFYTDVDMDFVDVVSDDILCDGLTMTYHPGFYSKKDIVGQWGSNGVAKESLAWLEPEKRKGYVAGGFNGGRSEDFLEMANILNQNISDDEKRGVMAEYHDESHMNLYIKKYYLGKIKYLDPSYCLVEQKELRLAWGISHLPERIIALAKDHKSIRE